MEIINRKAELLQLINVLPQGKSFTTIAEKVVADERITDEEGLFLFEKATLGLSAALAKYIREKKHGDRT